LSSGALLGSHSIESCGLLFDVLAATMRASILLTIVLPQSECLFEALAAILAVIIVHGHRTPPDQFRRHFIAVRKNES
jgi:hypothetical protein